jgi:hypothetical protein
VELKFGQTLQKVTIIEGGENMEYTIQKYAGGNKSVHGVGSDVANFAGSKLAAQLKFKLNKTFSNNQKQQLAIVNLWRRNFIYFFNFSTPCT